MAENSITVDHLTKIFHLFDKPTDRLKEALLPFGKAYHRDFYALNDVSFEIKKGETVGIIGKNGAGKSTLLKVLTGVLTSSSGQYFVDGKVASLLELGTGFNPEMTGIENIYLFGSLIGYTHQQMKAKIESIIEFAEIGDFIRQPVKTYSSGMYVRLAFSVAINVEPDVLIIDEALSVGDIRFQLKCYRNLKEIQARGTTILLVTHDTGAVLSYCSSAIWLENGKVKATGSPKNICKRYLSFMTYGVTTNDEENNSVCKERSADDGLSAITAIPFETVDHCNSFGDGGAKITGVAVCCAKTRSSLHTIDTISPVSLFIEFEVYQDIYQPIAGFFFSDVKGNAIFGSNNIYRGIPFPPFRAQINKKEIIEFKFTFPRIRNGDYVLTVAIAEGSLDNHIQHHWVHDAFVLKVHIPTVEHQVGNQIILEEIDIRCPTYDQKYCE